MTEDLHCIATRIGDNLRNRREGLGATTGDMARYLCTYWDVKEPGAKSIVTKFESGNRIQRLGRAKRERLSIESKRLCDYAYALGCDTEWEINELLKGIDIIQPRWCASSSYVQAWSSPD